MGYFGSNWWQYIAQEQKIVDKYLLKYYFLGTILHLSTLLTI
jgi:hypothetical protein